ncbi:GtrA family protein [Stenotrophomonas sp.]|uniref:GtrA family protein n=1 Tax=Stenotrophomonas sp. TaxID=69392 RepID=UPI0028A066E5|nr:GtrA family protein [Stenotrophomonas sp.]
MIKRQFLMFLVAGGIAAAVNFGSRIILSEWMRYVPAIVIAYCLGMVTAFILNRLLVFQEAANALKHQIAWFVLVNLAAVVQTIAISLVLARWLLPVLGVDFHNETLAHAVGVAVPVVTSYFGHKYLSFASSPRKA